MASFTCSPGMPTWGYPYSASESMRSSEFVKRGPILKVMNSLTKTKVPFQSECGGVDDTRTCDRCIYLIVFVQ